MTRLKLGLEVAAAVAAIAVAAAGLTVRAQAPMMLTQVVAIQPRIDVFQTGDTQSFTLTGTPANTIVMVFYNGVLMAPGIDYTLSGAGLTFTGQTIGDSPTIQVLYWVAAQ